MKVPTSGRPSKCEGQFSRRIDQFVRTLIAGSRYQHLRLAWLDTQIGVARRVAESLNVGAYHVYRGARNGIAIHFVSHRYYDPKRGEGGGGTVACAEGTPACPRGKPAHAASVRRGNAATLAPTRPLTLCLRLNSMPLGGL